MPLFFLLSLADLEFYYPDWFPFFWKKMLRLEFETFNLYYFVLFLLNICKYLKGRKINVEWIFLNEGEH
jgi:hypothetical protein